MSGETERNVSGWTVDTLKEYLDLRMVNIQILLDERYATQHAAIEKATSAAEKRFESVNEFRAALSDQQATFMTRNEYLPAYSNLAEKIEALTVRVNARDNSGKGFVQSIGFMLSAAAVIVTTIIAVTTIALS